MISRSVVHRLITGGLKPGSEEALTLVEEPDVIEIESDDGASRRQILRRFGAFGLAVASGGAFGSEVEAKNRRRGNRNKNQNGRSAGNAAGSAEAPAELTSAEVGAEGQVTSEAITLITSPGPTSSARQWKINTVNSGSLTPNVKFSMRNTRGGSYLKYGSRWWGINLVWTSTNTRTFSVRRSSGTTSAIKYGETVALRIDGGGYVKYASRDFGINLGWSSTPVYQWQIRGGTTGTIVPNNATVQLYNNVAPRTRFPPWCGKPGSAVVYSWRPVGVNLVWNPPGFWIPTYSIPLVPNWAESWLKKIAETAAQAYGVPVEQYKTTYKTLCSVVRSTGVSGGESNESSEAYQEDASYASLDAAALKSIADDKLASGDALTDEDPVDLGADDGNDKNRKRKRKQRKHGNGNGNGNHRGGNGRGNGRHGHH